MSGLRASLFLKFYIAMVAALLLLVLVLAMLWRMALDRPDPRDNFPRRIAEAILPDADAPRDEQRRALSRIAEALDADVRLVMPDGRVIGYRGDPEMEPRRGSWRDEPRRLWRVRLSDGRLLLARFETPLRAPFWRMALGLLLAALIAALAAWPAVRLLTRRLEKL